ncbi:hypothetical protein C8R47DRAFT_1162602, partial [Mycena vitilis]
DAEKDDADADETDDDDETSGADEHKRGRDDRSSREPERHPVLLLPREAPERARCRLALVPRRGGVARVGLGLGFGCVLLALNAGAEGCKDAGGRERGFCFSTGRAGGGGEGDVAGAGGAEDAGGRGRGFGTDRGSDGRGRRGGCDVCNSAQRRGTGKGAGAAGAEAGGDLHLSDVDSGHLGRAGSPERLRKLCAGIDEDGGGGQVRGTDDGAKRRGAGAGADAARAEARRGLACVELLQTTYGCSDNGNGGNGRGGGFTHDGATASSDTSNSNNGLRNVGVRMRCGTYLLNSNDGLDGTYLNIDDARLPLRDLVRNVQSEEVQSRENDDGQHKHDKPDRRRREGGRGGRGSGEGRHCVVGGLIYTPHRFLSPMQSPSQSPR